MRKLRPCKTVISDINIFFDNYSMISIIKFVLHENKTGNFDNKNRIS